MEKIKKIVLFLLVFLAPYAIADTLSQSDFYGIWKYTDSEGTLILTFTQNAWTAQINNDNPMTVEIIRWEFVNNNNVNTFQIFPNGYRITIRQLNGNIASVFIYINVEKTHIIMPEFSSDAVITKQ